MNDLLKQLPQIQALLEAPTMASLIKTHGRAGVTDALRQALNALRDDILAGHRTDLPDPFAQAFADDLHRRITESRAPTLKPVINATGIIVHTNLGRACLAPEAITAMNAVAAGYSTLELDLETGTRGTRQIHTQALICELTGAEAALVVNNCAAAVLLSLMATATGRKVVASRGELIEIGGAFRLPDVIEQSGAILKEVGATNKTRTADYERAIDTDTAVLLKSHTSNYRITGFTSAPDRRDLVHLAMRRDVLMMEDLGSGVLMDLSPYGLVDEPVVGDIIRAGVDLVMFSGDKLLGGPQCGIIAGRADIIDRIKTHPLARAVRIDKLSLAALDATLRLYRAPHDPLQRIPVLRALSATLQTVTDRAEALAEQIRSIPEATIDIFPAAAFVGGGSLPQQDLESMAVSVALPSHSAQHLSAKLRAADTPIIGRISKDQYILDARTLSDTDVPEIVASLKAIQGP